LLSVEWDTADEECVADSSIPRYFATNSFFRLATKGAMQQAFLMVRVVAIFVVFLLWLPTTTGAAVYEMAAAANCTVGAGTIIRK